MGWIGSKEELFQVLRTFDCDRDEDGKFNVTGPITSFLGLGEEFVVGDDAVFYVRGEPRNLVGALGSTSYGLSVKVI